MNSKCQNCGEPATVHLTEIENGEKIEKHLCEHCAAEEGITIKSNVPISQLLEDFILQASPKAQEDQENSCPVCGLSFAEFRENGMLGCPHDYDAFGDKLQPLVQSAQAGADQHVGKIPRRAGLDQKRQNQILRLRAQLKGAVATEDYEQAAQLRDQIRDLESE
jgi:protein arginine kinase activator